MITTNSDPNRNGEGKPVGVETDDAVTYRWCRGQKRVCCICSAGAKLQVSVVLRCVVLCCAVLCCVALCCVVLCRVALMMLLTLISIFDRSNSA